MFVTETTNSFSSETDQPEDENNVDEADNPIIPPLATRKPYRSKEKSKRRRSECRQISRYHRDQKDWTTDIPADINSRPQSWCYDRVAPELPPSPPNDRYRPTSPLRSISHKDLHDRVCKAVQDIWEVAHRAQTDIATIGDNDKDRSSATIADLMIPLVVSRAGCLQSLDAEYQWRQAVPQTKVASTRRDFSFLCLGYQRTAHHHNNSPGDLQQFPIPILPLVESVKCAEFMAGTTNNTPSLTLPWSMSLQPDQGAEAAWSMTRRGKTEDASIHPTMGMGCDEDPDEANKTGNPKGSIPKEANFGKICISDNRRVSLVTL
ncbi:hypothetical protein CcaCcLH18_13372 [Colletotrichum camelliae]|nr:hypothetical protein CcaCcLH18_13372 [Colletotrichum camelliae]